MALIDAAHASGGDPEALQAAGQAFAEAGSLVGAAAAAVQQQEPQQQQEQQQQQQQEQEQEQEQQGSGMAEAASSNRLVEAASSNGGKQLVGVAGGEVSRVHAGSAVKLLRYRSLRRPRGLISDVAPVVEGGEEGEERGDMSLEAAGGDGGGGGWLMGGPGVGAMTSTFGREYSERPWLVTKASDGVVGFEDEVCVCVCERERERERESGEREERE